MVGVASVASDVSTKIGSSAVASPLDVVLISLIVVALAFAARGVWRMHR